jgi:hypothetical protein
MVQERVGICTASTFPEKRISFGVMICRCIRGKYESVKGKKKKSVRVGRVQ